MSSMNTTLIAERLKQANSQKRVRRMPRGMLDILAPAIYESTKAGMSLHDIRRHFESQEGLLVTVPAISAALKRNGLVSTESNNSSHNV